MKLNKGRYRRTKLNKKGQLVENKRNTRKLEYKERTDKAKIEKTKDLHPEVASELMEDFSYVRKLRNSEDYKEGPNAFAEKRKPVSKGR